MGGGKEGGQEFNRETLPMKTGWRMCSNLGDGTGTLKEIGKGGESQFYLDLKGQGNLRDKG